jgi:hypothetical protein
VALFDGVAEFPLDEHEAAFQNYRRRRGSKAGIRFPRTFEAAIGLELAERYRLDGQFERCFAAVRLAADDFPEHSVFRERLEHLSPETTISWRKLLTPQVETSPQKVKVHRVKHVVRRQKSNRIHWK